MFNLIASLGLTHLVMDVFTQVFIVKNAVTTGRFLLGKSRPSQRVLYVKLKTNKPATHSFSDYRQYKNK